MTGNISMQTGCTLHIAHCTLLLLLWGEIETNKLINFQLPKVKNCPEAKTNKCPEVETNKYLEVETNNCLEVESNKCP